MMRTICRFTILLAAMMISAVGVVADDEARTALVVGVKDYHDRYFHSLDAPIEDMKAVRAKLEALGFQVEVLANPNRRQLTEAVDAFGDRLSKRGGVGLFYFSGHGAMKSDEEANYLIPAGTNIRSENDLPEEAVNAQRIANRMKEAKNSLNVVLLDACRSHGLPRGDGAKSAGGGLAAMRGARGLIFFFATQPGAVAIEDSDAKSSIFTRALLQKMDTPGLSFMDMMSDVSEATEHLSLIGITNPKTEPQTPFVSGTVIGRFYFNPQVELARLMPPVAVVPTVPAVPITPTPRIDPFGQVGKSTPFENSLGMKFVPAGKRGVLFSVWDTRVQDYRQFVSATNRDMSGAIYVMKVKKNDDGGYSNPWDLDQTTSWKSPGFEQGETHPVVGVSLEDGRAFCEWLTQKERQSGMLPEGASYRLPTDEEWSAAVGSVNYPWGDSWPPKGKVGNYEDESFAKGLPGKSWPVVPGMKDGWPRTSPVGSYVPNAFGLYDMGGNVWQWCDTDYKASMNSAEAIKAYPILKEERSSDGTPYRVLRGGSWGNGDPIFLRSSFRTYIHSSYRVDDCGFRCVLVVSDG